MVSNEVVITAQEKKEPNKEEAEAAAEMKASIDKAYIVLYNLRGPGLQFVTGKKAEVPSPSDTKLLVISTKEATSIIEHLAEQEMFAKASQPLEGAHPGGWYIFRLALPRNLGGACGSWESRKTTSQNYL